MTDKLRNGLVSISLGDFDEDPKADTVYQAFEKIQTNIETLDNTVGTVAELDSDVQSLENKGLTIGFVHGGSF